MRKRRRSNCHCSREYIHKGPLAFAGRRLIFIAGGSSPGSSARLLPAALHTQRLRVIVIATPPPNIAQPPVVIIGIAGMTE